MATAEKMLSGSPGAHTSLADEAPRRDSESLFEDDWEVFVIRRDDNGRLDWFTLCCETNKVDV